MGERGKRKKKEEVLRVERSTHFAGRILSESGELSQRNLFQRGCPEHQILYQSQGEGLNSYMSFPQREDEQK